MWVVLDSMSINGVKIPVRGWEVDCAPKCAGARKFSREIHVSGLGSLCNVRSTGFDGRSAFSRASFFVHLSIYDVA